MKKTIEWHYCFVYYEVRFLDRGETAIKSEMDSSLYIL